jgi:membrane associated rhomboid family serine protease
VGVIAIFIVLIGMVQTFAKRYLTGEITLGMVILLAFGLVAGVLAARQVAKSSPRLGHKVLAAAISGLITGVMLAALLLVVSQVSLRDVLVNATPEMVAPSPAVGSQ